jgi:arginine N-succinyltransferase
VFNSDLMPKHPVYVAMLDDEARSAIGMPHPTGRAAMRMLEDEGFRHDGYVDIFDGGPTMTARTDDVRSVREARPGTVTSVNLDIGDRALLATGTLGNFRAAFGMRDTLPDGSVEIDHRSAALLGVSVGDEVWSVLR